MTLSGKKILLGVSGGIAAYKAVYLLRSLKKAGATVRVVITPSTEHFVGELTFAALSDLPVFKGLWDESWSEHVTAGLWADLLLVAPATAQTLAKFSHGFCDNALTAVYLAARCPVMVAPAMDVDMYRHPRTQANLSRLREDGVNVLPAGIGFLASGLQGPGRLLEPDEIMQHVHDFFGPLPLAGKKLLITAGPTQEAIDPVRYLSNHSSGKMGYALARQAQRMGAAVTLVSGPTALPQPEGVAFVPVRSAREMYQAVMDRQAHQDILIMAAAVADFAPMHIAGQKLKKGEDDEMVIRLKKTPDILASIGAQKRPEQLLIGFALETNDEEANARKKLTQKNADAIVLNSLQTPGAGFTHDTNQISIIPRRGETITFPLKNKEEVARDILKFVVHSS